MSSNQTWPALVGRQSGLVEIQGGSLVFTYDDGVLPPLRLSIASLDVKHAGENSHHFYLKDRNLPRVEIGIQDPRLIDLLSERGVATALVSRSVTRRKTGQRIASIGSFIFLTVFLMVGIPIAFSYLPINWINAVVSEEREAKLGSILLPVLARARTQDHPAYPAVLKIVERLRSANRSLQGFPLTVHIVPTDQVNAFALPGGNIVVNTGLLKKATSVSEVAGVIGHELGHVERRHVTKAVVAQLGVSLGIGSLSFITGSDVAQWVGMGTGIFNLRYSRANESEADERSVEFLSAAGISSNGMVDFFKRLQKEHEMHSSSQALAVLSTHPLSTERSQKIAELAKRFPVQEQALDVTLADLQKD